MKEQPFYIGQRVVTVTRSDSWSKGQEFIITGLKISSCCKKWVVSINMYRGPTVCKNCYSNLGGEWYHHHCFVPIEEAKFKQITYEKIIETIPMCVQ